MPCTAALYPAANTVITSAIGFVFWRWPHMYPPPLSACSQVISGAILLATIAALGLPNVMISHIATAANARGLVLMAVMAIATVGTILCLVTFLLSGPISPPCCTSGNAAGWRSW